MAEKVMVNTQREAQYSLGAPRGDSAAGISDVGMPLQESQRRDQGGECGLSRLDERGDIAGAAVVAASRRSVRSPEPSPWLTVREAAARARCGAKTVYREVQAGRLRAAVVGGRRALRFRAEWVDQWLEACAPMEVNMNTSTISRRS